MSKISTAHLHLRMRADDTHVDLKENLLNPREAAARHQIHEVLEKVPLPQIRKNQLSK